MKVPEYFCFKVMPDPKKLVLEIERAEIDDVISSYRKKAHWKRCEDDVCYWFECSACGHEPLYTKYKQEILSDYCPYCGALMLEEDNDVSESV